MTISKFRTLALAFLIFNFAFLIAHAAAIPGTVILNKMTLGDDSITNKSIGDTVEMKGTPKQVANTAARDAIPAARRTEGMECWVIDVGLAYRLVGGILNANWVEVTAGSGTTIAQVNAIVQTNQAGTFYVSTYGAVGNGVADDTQPILNTIAAAKPTGGVVVFQSGVYVIKRPLVLPSAVQLRGNGASTVITKPTSVRSFLASNASAGAYSVTVVSASAFAVSNAIYLADINSFEQLSTRSVITNIAGNVISFSSPIVGNLLTSRGAFATTTFNLIGNEAFSTNIVVRNLVLDQNRSLTGDTNNDFMTSTISLESAYYSLVEDVVIQNSASDSYSDQGTNGLGIILGVTNIVRNQNTFRNNIIQNGGRHGVHIGTALSGSLIEGNTITNVAGFAMFYCAFATESRAVGNNVVNCSSGFAGIDWRDFGNVIANNTIRGCTNYSIEASSGDGTGGRHTISGNVISGAPIYLKQPDSTIMGNTIECDLSKSALIIGTTADRTTIQGNTIVSLGGAGSMGVELTGADDCRLIGNLIKGSSTGIYAEGASRLVAIGNMMSGVTGYLWLFDGAACTNVVIRSEWNTAANPVSQLVPVVRLVYEVGSNGTNNPASAGDWNGASGQMFNGSLVRWNNGTERVSTYFDGIGWTELTGGGSSLSNLTDSAYTALVRSNLVVSLGGSFGGRVGIGTASPAKALHLYSTNAGEAEFRIEEPEPVIILKDQNAAEDSRILTFENASQSFFLKKGNDARTVETPMLSITTVGRFSFYGNGFEHVRFNSDGGVAIGNPFVATADMATNDLIVAGSVGIGTNVPFAKLHVVGNQVTTGTNQAAYFVGDGSLLTGIAGGGGLDPRIVSTSGTMTAGSNTFVATTIVGTKLFADELNATNSSSLTMTAAGQTLELGSGGLTLSGSGAGYIGPAGNATIDASGFNGVLATSDNTIQEALQKLDDLSVGGASLNHVLTALSTNNAQGTLTNANPTNLFGAGVIPIAKLATGTPDGSKFIRDDGTLQAIPGGGDALVANPLSQFAETTSAQLRGVLSDEDGTGVFLTANGSGSSLTAVNAITGDSATAFFSTGTLEDARLSANVSLLGSAIDLSGAEATGALAAGRFPALTGDVTTTAGSLATTIAANSVALTTDTTGNYAAGDAEAGAALTGDSATAFFSTGTLEPALMATNAAFSNAWLRATSATTAEWSRDGSGLTNIAGGGSATNAIPLLDGNGTNTHLWSANGPVITLKSDTMELFDATGLSSVDWGLRNLNGPSGLVANWSDTSFHVFGDLQVDGTSSFDAINVGTLNVTNFNIGFLVVSNTASIRTNIGQFDVSTTAFVIGTRYTNSTRRAFVTASFQLSAAAAGTAAVSLRCEQSGVTNRVNISAGPLASLSTVEQLSLMVGPDARYYFVDDTSGTGASVSIVAGTSSRTDF